ncbi:signal peptidase I [Amycolatopsis orientalis]|uniref:signal peptidase I n=1 Tax=Amycolatopsis orientalis TaxID=31958 RepID=UPI000684F0DC|nr:signal peptidase I [Amycolatopsis orientalis]
MIDGFPAPPPVSREPRRFSVVLALFVVVALTGVAACGYGLLTVFGYRWVKVPDNVMAPAVPAGTTIVFGKRDGQVYHRGDVVLARMPAHQGDRAFILLGRVIGVGGDDVRCCDEKRRIVVDGKSVDEPYESGDGPQFRAVVPKDAVFLAGDRRDLGWDSRNVEASGLDGSVPVSQVYGVVAASGPNRWWVRTLPPTTAFTAAGLPGAPEVDQGPFLGRVLAGAGAGVFLVGFLGAVGTGVRRGRKRRRAAGDPWLSAG